MTVETISEQRGLGGHSRRYSSALKELELAFEALELVGCRRARISFGFQLRLGRFARHEENT